ncbi:phage portal protein [Rhodoplanes sp. SY1]|uniref:phage portal protein n=1 Tax=Rhodoplanes sp. SY1 TaxID=3166646 RepID=UPI0038B59EA8
MPFHSLVDPSGAPLRPRAEAPFVGASRTHQDLVAWWPRRVSPVTALPQADRDLLTDRIADQARNDGWASAGMDRLVDNVIGAGWGLNVTLPRRRLGLTEQQAADLAGSIEEAFDEWASDPESCDAGQRLGFGGLLALGYRHGVRDGEALAAISFLPRGGAWATAVEMIHPARLAQPDFAAETTAFRQGIELGPTGEPVAYHVRVAHPADGLGYASGTFARLPRSVNGRRLVAHAYEAREAGQIRGVPLFAPVVKKLRMLGRYDETELQAALLNASMATFITSPFDHEALAEALGAGDGKALDGAIAGYLAGKLGYWKDAPPIHLPGAAVNFLYPGERAEHTPPTHPNAVFEHFVRAGLRHVAAALGLSYEQLSADWGQVNYSSARAALLEVWRGFSRRAALYATDFAQPVYVRWLEEAVVRGRVALPAGSPAFAEAKAAWTRCRWRMPGRGWVDPLKEADAAAVRIGLGVSTLEREAAEQGLDWEENLRQRARELAAARRLEEEYGLEAGTLVENRRDRPDVIRGAVPDEAPSP